MFSTGPSDQLHLLADGRDAGRGRDPWVSSKNEPFINYNFPEISKRNHVKIICSFLFEKQRKDEYESALRQKLDLMRPKRRPKMSTFPPYKKMPNCEMTL